MRIYEELDNLGFFKWYCTQYGGLNYTEYKEVYDALPLDNIIRTELNACVFKFFREQHKSLGRVVFGTKKYAFSIYDINGHIILRRLHLNISHDEAEFECIANLIALIKL